MKRKQEFDGKKKWTIDIKKTGFTDEQALNKTCFRLIS